MLRRAEALAADMIVVKEIGELGTEVVIGTEIETETEEDLGVETDTGGGEVGQEIAIQERGQSEVVPGLAAETDTGEGDQDLAVVLDVNIIGDLALAVEPEMVLDPSQLRKAEPLKHYPCKQIPIFLCEMQDKPRK